MVDGTSLAENSENSLNITDLDPPKDDFSLEILFKQDLRTQVNIFTSV